MLPSKCMVDYMSEMNKLFPRNEHEFHSSTCGVHTPPFKQSTSTRLLTESPESLSPESLFLHKLRIRDQSLCNCGQQEDFQSKTHSLQSPFNQLMARSSPESPDSLSPESLPDPVKEYQRASAIAESSFVLYDTPTLYGRRQRPIVGRKLLSPDAAPFEFRTEQPTAPWKTQEPPIWPSEDQVLSHTPPNYLMDQKHYTQNVFYELFPSESRGYEFKTPVKKPPISNISPSSRCTQSPTPWPLNLPPTLAQSTPNIGFQPRREWQPSSPNWQSPNTQDIGPTKICTLCRKNGETPLVYMDHNVKERIGNKMVVTCPILRSHKCNVCGVTGDNAHTLTYCPVLRSNNNGAPLQSTTITLKNTRVKSNGRRRF